MGSSRRGTVHKGEVGLNQALAGSTSRPARWSQQMPFLRVDTVRARFSDAVGECLLVSRKQHPGSRTQATAQSGLCPS